MNIPDLIDGFITWQSTLPCRANQVACSRRSDSGARAKNKASERAGKNEGRLGRLPALSLALFFARAPLSERLEQATIRKLRSWTNGFFKIVGFAGKRFLSSLPFPLLVLFGARPNFRAFKKILQTCGKPYGNACYAG